MPRDETRLAVRLKTLLQVEEGLWARGFTYVAGCDEAGVGPLAGPVVAAAVILPQDSLILGIDDSKVLSPLRRTELAEKIRSRAVAWAIGIADVAEIDRLNIYQASLLALRRAVQGLSVRPDHIVTDARRLDGLPIPQLALVRGDARSYSVAAASILAKVHRDMLMRQYHEQFPFYGFDRNVGYGTPEHFAALKQHGPCPLHRRSFAPVRQLVLFGRETKPPAKPTRRR